MILIIKTPQKRFPIEIHPEDRIEDIKSQIQEKEGISLNKQRLILNNRLLENGKQIQDYSLQDNDVISLFQISKDGIIIFIEIAKGKYLPLEVEQTDSIANIKLQIQEQKVFQPKQIKLCFNYQFLSDEKNISDYNILENSILKLLITEKGFPIFINVIINPKGTLNIARYFPLEISCTESIQDIKLQIENREIYKKILLFAGKVLDNSKSIMDCSIASYSRLSLIISVPKEYEKDYLL